MELTTIIAYTANYCQYCPVKDHQAHTCWGLSAHRSKNTHSPGDCGLQRALELTYYSIWPFDLGRHFKGGEYCSGCQEVQVIL